MKFKKYLIFALMLFALACQNRNADRNMNDDAILMEDAKVEREKPDTTHSGHDSDTLRNR